jgi:hypothetical protein
MLFKKLVILFYLLPLTFTFGFFLSCLMPNDIFLIKYSYCFDRIVSFAPAILLIFYVYQKPDVNFLKTKTRMFFLVLSYFCLLLPISFAISIYINCSMGAKVFSPSLFISNVEYSGGKDYSFLQGFDAAYYINGKYYSWRRSQKKFLNFVKSQMSTPT